MESNNCSKFSAELSHTLALRITNGTASSISLLCCIFVIALMIIYKKYAFTIQRLILYLTVSILLYSITHIFESASYTLAQADSYCMALGFLEHYCGYCMLLFVPCFLLEIGVRMICLRETGAIEWLYIPAIFVTPLLVTWIPFLTGNYGRMGLSCEIVTINSTTCEQDIKGLALIIIAMIIRRMQGAFILIAVTMDPKTRKRLKWRHIKAAFIENVLCKYSNIEEYPIISAPNYTDSLNPN